MLVETQSLTTISVGTQKSQTEPGDTTLRIPNVILPSIELIEPTQIAPNNSEVMQNSFQRSQYFSRTNQVAATFPFCRLGRGLWELRFSWIHRFLYAAAILGANNNNFVQLVSPVGGISVILSSLLPVGTTVGYQQFFGARLLLRETGEIQIGVDVTGAADFLETNLSLNASKLL